MKNSSRFNLLVGYMLCVHLLGLAMLSLFRLAEFFFLNDKISQQGEGNPAEAFLRGGWFDNVVGCYIIVIPLIIGLSVATIAKSWRWAHKGSMIFISFFYILAFAVSASNIPYFAYFAKNINSSIFNWLSYAGTTTGMIVGEKSYWLYIALFLCVSIFYLWCMLKLFRYFDNKINNTKEDCRLLKPIVIRLLITFVLGGLCIFGIRGRVGYNPIKISEAYYCNNSFLNQLGISPSFNLLTSFLDDMRPENKELQLISYAEAISVARESLNIEGKTDSTHVLRRHIKPEVSKLSKPNIIIILMESMSGSFLHSLGQKGNITPVLDSLYHTSWAFTHFYSAGIHTNHGITASLYSFPALMKRNLMKGTVTPKREGLPTVLKANGYQNMFFMTHESQYDNMNAFLRTNGYDYVYAQEDYPIEERVNAFGVSDHFLFDYSLKTIEELNQKGKPWMATLLTISNHPPYVIPDWFQPRTGNEESQIVEYADWCIGDFLNKARQQAWYDNTIFVILADHGKIVGEIDSELPESYNHVPLMIFGPNIEAKIDEQLAIQVDLMPTILGIIGMEYDFDGFGIDLSREHRRYAFYTADDQIVGRDLHSRYVFTPTTKQEFFEGDDRRLSGYLKRYALSMVQTAEYIMRQTIQ